MGTDAKDRLLFPRLKEILQFERTNLAKSDSFLEEVHLRRDLDAKPHFTDEQEFVPSASRRR
jgi:hypothetical protein